MSNFESHKFSVFDSAMDSEFDEDKDFYEYVQSELRRYQNFKKIVIIAKNVNTYLQILHKLKKKAESDDDNDFSYEYHPSHKSTPDQAVSRANLIPYDNVEPDDDTKYYDPPAPWENHDDLADTFCMFDE